MFDPYFKNLTVALPLKWWIKTSSKNVSFEADQKNGACFSSCFMCTNIMTAMEFHSFAVEGH